VLMWPIRASPATNRAGFLILVPPCQEACCKHRNFFFLFPIPASMIGGFSWMSVYAEPCRETMVLRIGPARFVGAYSCRIDEVLLSTRRQNRFSPLGPSKQPARHAACVLT